MTRSTLIAFAACLILISVGYAREHPSHNKHLVGPDLVGSVPSLSFGEGRHKLYGTRHFASREKYIDSSDENFAGAPNGLEGNDNQGSSNDEDEDSNHATDSEDSEDSYYTVLLSCELSVRK